MQLISGKQTGALKIALYAPEGIGKTMGHFATNGFLAPFHSGYLLLGDSGFVC